MKPLQRGHEILVVALVRQSGKKEPGRSIQGRLCFSVDRDLQPQVVFGQNLVGCFQFPPLDDAGPGQFNQRQALAAFDGLRLRDVMGQAVVLSMSAMASSSYRRVTVDTIPRASVFSGPW